MFWSRRLASYRFLLTMSLFLIGCLHTMIFAFFQIPGNFLLGSGAEDLILDCKLVLYACAIGTALSHQALCRIFGLRKVLYLGLLFNLFGLAILWFNQVSPVKGFVPLIFLDMIFFGISITSVICALITYIILEYPKKLGVGITALFIFFNAGSMLAPVLLDIFNYFSAKTAMYPFLIALLIFAIWFVHAYFFDPQVPAHIERLRKGTLLWRELHYRLGLFAVAVIAFGLTETTFQAWGLLQIKATLGPQIATEIISVFWLFVILGQIFLLVPLYFFAARRVFYFLIALSVGALINLPVQTTLPGIIFGLAIAGLGCSAMVPILLSMIEREVLHFSFKHRVLPYIEGAASVVIAAYFIGVGVIDFWVEWVKESPLLSIPAHFHLAIYFIGATGVVVLYLNLTSPKKLF